MEEAPRPDDSLYSCLTNSAHSWCDHIGGCAQGPDNTEFQHLHLRPRETPRIRYHCRRDHVHLQRRRPAPGTQRGQVTPPPTPGMWPAACRCCCRTGPTPTATAPPACSTSSMAPATRSTASPTAWAPRGLGNSGGTVLTPGPTTCSGPCALTAAPNGTEFTFTGEQNDPNGLEYLRARYYDPATGRFRGGPAGWWVSVRRRNPANLVDPSGLYWIACEGDPQCIWSEEVGLPAEPPLGCSEPGGYGYCLYPNGEVYLAGGAQTVYVGMADDWERNVAHAVASACDSAGQCGVVEPGGHSGRHGPSECYEHGFECYERFEMAAIGVATVSLGAGTIWIGCATAVLCPVAVFAGGTEIVAGGALA